MAENASRVLTEQFVTDFFSSCIDEGADLSHDDDTFVLTFGPPNKFYFGFSILGNDEIKCFSDLPGMNEVVKADAFIDHLDVLSASLLQAHDGVDRGVLDVDA